MGYGLSGHASIPLRCMCPRAQVGCEQFMFVLGHTLSVLHPNGGSGFAVPPVLLSRRSERPFVDLQFGVGVWPRVAGRERVCVPFAIACIHAF